jgi:predicted DNA-binding transcriptional regulator AlpA
MDDRIYGVGTSPGADPDGPPVIDWSKVPLPPIPEEPDVIGRTVATPGFDPGPVLTVREAAERLGVTDSVVRYLLYNGKLVPVPQGRRIYATLESVDAEAAYRRRKTERRSRRIDGGWSAPREIDDDDRGAPDDLITTKQAAAILGISRITMSQLGKRGKLPRVRTNGSAWGYPRNAVLALAARRERKRQSKERPDVFCWGPRNRTIDRADLITLAEAASILGNSPAATGKLVRRGVLPGYQDRPYRQGSPIMVPYCDVTHLSARPSYVKRRADSAKDRPKHERVGPGWEEYFIEPVPNRGWTRSSDIDHGGQYSTRQAAAVLGIGPARVRELARCGRLHAVRRPYCAPRPGRVHRVRHVGNRWLFFDKQEVHALLDDAQYRKKRAADRLGRDPKRREEREAAAIARFYATNPPHASPHAWLYNRESFLADLRAGDQGMRPL